MIDLKRTDSKNPDFVEMVKFLDMELAERDGEDHTFYAQYNKLEMIKHVIVGYLDGSPICCGALKHFDKDRMEVKRMFTHESSRGKGFASALLSNLEMWARELGYTRCILETAKNQPEAIRLYEKNGYDLIPNYGQYVDAPNSKCFEKSIIG